MRLTPEDRAAITLRFFEACDLRSVGEALGVSEDTAQKRVSRALDKMRVILQREGVTICASMLGAILAASEATAPAGLATSIGYTVSSVTITRSVLIATSKAITMTTLQKTLVSATIAALAATGVYENYRASRLTRESETMRQEQAQLLQATQRERDELTQRVAALAKANELLDGNAAELLRLRGQISAMRAKLNTGQNRNTAEPAIVSWLGRVKEFKELPARMPARAIPELKLLTEEDWLDLAKEPLGHDAREIDLQDEDTARLVFREIRDKAKDKLVRKLAHALDKYVSANDGMLPAEMGQLGPHITTSLFSKPGHVEEVIDPAVDEAMLERYEILQKGKLEAVPPDRILVIAEKAPVDDRFDSRAEIGKNWMSVDNDPKAYLAGNGLSDPATSGGQ
jgi:hypothetical protein